MLSDRKTRAALRFARVVLLRVVDYDIYPHSINKQLTREEAANTLYRLLKQPVKSKEHAYHTILERLEWTGTATIFNCPECKNTKAAGHAPGCELAALLKEG